MDKNDDGTYTLIDYKTTYRIDKTRAYNHYFNQLYAYKLVLENQGINLSSIKVLCINTNDCKSFGEVDFPISSKNDSIVIENLLHYKDILERAKNNNWLFNTKHKDGCYTLQLTWNEKSMLIVNPMTNLF